MDITITSENKKEYLLIESKGILKTSDDLLKHAELIYAEIIKYDCAKILINEPGTSLPLDITQYFSVVKNYRNHFPSEIRELRLAIVVNTDYREVAETWETLCVSRGFQYFAFTSFEEAKNWLLKESKKL